MHIPIKPEAWGIINDHYIAVLSLYTMYVQCIDPGFFDIIKER